MIKLFNYIFFFSLFTALFSCKKLNYEDGITPFGEVYFDINAPALYEHLKVKYNGNAVELQAGTGRVRIPQGEGKFEFYDERTDEVLAEKTVNIIPGSPETFLLFQPMESAPIAILDPNEQANEEAAPEGYLKIKVANYTNKALPYDKIDIIVEGLDDWAGWLALDTIESIGTNLENAEYLLVKKGENIASYRFSYLNHANQEEILNARGTLYTSGGVWEYPNRQKDVFTIFLSDSHEADLEGASNAVKGRGVVVDGRYIYRITPNILFAD